MLYDFRDFTLDERTYQLRRGREFVPLERRVFDLLLYLIRNRTRVVSKAELFREVWSGRIVTEASLSVAMTAARRALGDSASNPTFIETHHTRGYRFIASVVERDSPASTLVGLSGVPFVGRAHELQMFDRALASALTGRMQIVLLSGEAGIGKTRIVEEFARPAENAGFQFMLGRCPDEAGAPPYWPWTQILRAYLAGADLSQRSDFTEAEAAGLSHILGQDPRALHAPEPPLENPAQARFRMFDAAAQIFERAAQLTPTVVAIDDIHRADEASLLLLSFLASSAPLVPLVIVATYRDTRTPRAPGFKQLLALLARSPHTESARLSGLSTEDARRLMERLTGEDLGDVSLSFALEKTNGNPFFLTHLARYLLTVPVRSMQSSLEFLPDDLLAAVGEHLGELPSTAQELLAMAAVIGTEVPLTVLSRVAEISPEEILLVLEPAVDARIVHPVTRAATFRFAHALVRDVLYQRLPVLRRASLHKMVGDALECLYRSNIALHLGAIAHHYYEAAPMGAASLALEYSTRAAEIASSHLAYEEAAEHYSRALELIDDAPDADDFLRCSLLIKLGTQSIKAGRRDLAKVPFDRAARIAQEIGATSLLAEVALSLAPGVLSIETGIVDGLLIEQLEQAIHALRGADAAVEAVLTARLAIALHWTDDDETINCLIERAHILASESTSPDARVFVRHALWFARRGPTGSAERLALAQDLVAESARADDAELELVCRLFLLSSLMERGEVVAFDTELDRYSSLAGRLRQPQGLWYVSMLRGMRALLGGRLVEAVELRDSFASLGGRVGDANAYHSAMAHSLLINFERDQLSSVLPAVSEAVERYPAVIGWRATRAWVLAQLGQRDLAQADYDQIARGSFSCIPKRLDWPATVALLSEAAVILGDKEGAKQLYEILLPFADRYFVIGLCVLNWGSVARHLGLLSATLENWQDAEIHLRRALRLNSSIGAIAWHAQTEIDLGHLYLRSGGAVGSLEDHVVRIRTTRETAARLGLSRIEREARLLEAKY